MFYGVTSRIDGILRISLRRSTVFDVVLYDV